MKILQAIVDSDGAAGFTEIKYATDLSTGSIYYHLSRMVRYVIKKSKQYYITKEGLELLQEHNGTSAMKWIHIHSQIFIRKYH